MMSARVAFQAATSEEVGVEVEAEAEAEEAARTAAAHLVSGGLAECTAATKTTSAAPRESARAPPVPPTSIGSVCPDHTVQEGDTDAATTLLRQLGRAGVAKSGQCQLLSASPGAPGQVTRGDVASGYHTW